MQVIRHPDHYKAVIAVIMIMLAQQLSGMARIAFEIIQLANCLRHQQHCHVRCITFG
jgi:hypothetical protein